LTIRGLLFQVGAVTGGRGQARGGGGRRQGCPPVGQPPPRSPPAAPGQRPSGVLDAGCFAVGSATGRWASEQGLALGQRAVDGKSNEITAIPELLDTLRLEGCIVTLDAMGCRKEIAERIRVNGADYLLVLKANHGHAFEAVREHFEHTCFGLGSGGRPVFDAFDESHGRLVRRRVFLDPAAKGLEPLRGWPELSAVLAVETVRGVTGSGKVETEIRYFLTSCGDDPAVLVQAIRRHWSVENALHWVLDVTFREDDSRVRDRTAARNLALLRKVALNLVARDRGSQASLRGRRKKAAWNDAYMLQIIANQAHA
jgi:predicted transposase YbfD/YdcC